LIAERNWALLEMGNNKELRPVLDEMLRNDRSAEFELQDAYLRLQTRDYGGARASAGEVLLQLPQEARAAGILAQSYAAQIPPAKVAEKLSETVTSYQTSLPLKQLVGEWYLRADNLSEARKTFEAIKAANPQYRAADLALADIDRREKRMDPARQRLNGVLKDDPKNIAALLQLATVEDESGNRDGAIAIYRSVLDIDSANLGGLNNLAYDLAFENPDEALRFAQQAAERAPENAFIQGTLGWVYYRKGAYSSAVRYLEAAVAKDPTPQRRFHLAMSYLKSGDRTRGQQMLATALQEDPALPKTERGW
jgi:tetratricopeptide (TPR) repeat protein